MNSRRRSGSQAVGQWIIVGWMVLAIGLGSSDSIAVASQDTAEGTTGAVPRLVTLDWGIAQDLTAMGVPPIGVGQTAGYATWVGAPPLSTITRNIGARAQPNLELLAQLDPDRILITKMYAAAASRLSRIAPVVTVDTYNTPGPVWANTVKAALELGRIAHRPAAAKALVSRTKAAIHKAAASLPAQTPPLLVVQFSDARHVRVYGKRSLIAATMKRMGLRCAWQGQTNVWGFAQMPLSRLAEVKHGRMVVMAPVPVGVADQIADSRIWQHLPVVEHAPVLYMPQVWSFGGLPSASRFARLIARALAHAPDRGPGWPHVSGAS